MVVSESRAIILGFPLRARYQIAIEPFDNAGSKIADYALSDSHVRRSLAPAAQVLKPIESDPEQLRAVTFI